MNPSFFFVWICLLVLLSVIAFYTRKKGNIASARAWSSLSWVVVGVGLSRFFVLDPVVVQGASMSPTLSDEEVVVVDKRAFGVRVPLIGARIGGHVPTVGDVVVFEGPDGDNWVKRVAGAPGDSIVFMEGRGWYRNGIPIAIENNKKRPDWMIMSGAQALSVPGGRTWGLVLGNDQLFLLGDNLPVSLDSRRIGPVSLSRILGRVS